MKGCYPFDQITSNNKNASFAFKKWRKRVCSEVLKINHKNKTGFDIHTPKQLKFLRNMWQPCHLSRHPHSLSLRFYFVFYVCFEIFLDMARSPKCCRVGKNNINTLISKAQLCIEIFSTFFSKVWHSISMIFLHKTLIQQTNNDSELRDNTTFKVKSQGLV